MSQDSAGNDSKRTPIRLEELDGWVRAFPDPDEDLTDDLDMRLAASVTEWFRCRPHLSLRCVYPIQKCGRNIELNAIFDERPGADPIPYVVDANGAITAYSYDLENVDGNIVTNHVIEQWTTAYDADRNVIAQIGPNGPVTVYAYGADVVDEWLMVFDANGDLVSTTKIDGKPLS